MNTENKVVLVGGDVMSRTRLALIAAGAAMGASMVHGGVAVHTPESDWKHDDERLRKAQEKRRRKAAKRVKGNPK